MSTLPPIFLQSIDLVKILGDRPLTVLLACSLSALGGFALGVGIVWYRISLTRSRQQTSGPDSALSQDDENQIESRDAAAPGDSNAEFQATALASKANEQFLQTVYTHAPTSVFVVEVGGRDTFRYHSLNPTHEEKTGLTSADIRGKTPEDIFPPDSAAMVRQHYRDCVSAGETISYEECLPFQGGDRWWLTHLTPLKTDRGRVYRLVGSCLDITRIKQAEQALQESLNEKNILLAEVHHRVKNNLQLIASLLSLKANRVTDGEAQEALQQMFFRVESIAQIHRILYQSDQMERIRFGDYARSIAHNLKASFAHDLVDIEMQVEVSPDILLTLSQAVPCALILNELVTNALKHGFKVCKTGFIKICMDQRNNQRFHLSVMNSGDRLPDNFSLDMPVSMGLQLVQALTEQLNGTLQINSTLETEFVIIF